MSKVIVGLLLLAVSIYGGNRIYRGYRRGRIVRPYFGVVSERYDRAHTPAAFWVSTIVSSAFVGMIAVESLCLIFLGLMQ